MSVRRADRTNFGSLLGIVLATAGSAVGLGNVWRFPYMTGQDGGAAFILIYLACVVFLGIPGMVAEFIVGRHSATNAARAYRKLAGCTPWVITGYLGIITSTLILGFYSVIAGWCLQYLYASASGQLQGDKDFIMSYFADFSANPIKPVLWALAFVLITHVIVARGIRHGIEKASKLMMPVLFILLIVIVIASCSLPGAFNGIQFLFKPDFTKITSNVFLDALGQAFFSLSLGTACLCTYASYFSRRTDLCGSAVQIALIDVVIAVLAGMMIFPAAFSVGVNPDSGPSLIFITLPNVFQQAFSGIPCLGYIISIFFYFLLALAALTSTLSMHEIGTAFYHEELHLTRKRGAWIETACACVIAVLCSLSVGAVEGIGFFGKSLLDCLDYLTAQLLLPVGSFLTCLLVGWYVPRHIVRNEFTNGGKIRNSTFKVFLFVVRFVCPIAIAAIFLHQFGML
ncbi:MAG: sodium-dependent transporter [Prevotella sp.]|nr:sodium-dependent transporter [Prevotella sp.]